MFAQATMFYFDIIIDFGFKLSATREIAVNVNSKTKINQIISSVFIIKSFLLIFSFLILYFIVNFFEKFNSNPCCFITLLLK